MVTLNISIPDTMKEWIDAQVEGGGYANASDYIRDLVRHDQRERESTLLALIEGERSGDCNVRKYELLVWEFGARMGH